VGGPAAIDDQASPCHEARIVRREEDDALGDVVGDTEQARKNTLALHPIGRLGVAEDIAKGIVFLASDDASFMTGAGLVVDGGWTAH